MANISVDEASLNELKNALATAGEEYKANLTRLQNLINEITSGDIQGDLANDLLAKFQDKETMFKALANAIDEAEEEMGMQTTRFTSTMSNITMH